MKKDDRIVVISNNPQRINEFREALKIFVGVDKFLVMKPKICLSQFNQGGIGLLFTDMNLHESDGVAVAEQLYRHNPDMVVGYVVESQKESEDSFISDDEIITGPVTEEKLRDFCNRQHVELNTQIHSDMV